jgi:peptidyl-tRNA hydrolase, PTH1 family
VAEDGWLVVGLGNPGPGYAGNRHNAGYRVVETLAGREPDRFRSHKGGADVATYRIGGARLLLAKPRSYMNDSGRPVAALRDFFKIPLDRLVVVHDELDLPFGALRLKAGGGENGHNGLRSVRQALGSGDFVRVRFGIGRPPGRQDPAEFVLRDFSPTERKELDFLVERAADAVEAVVADGLPAAQNAYNADPVRP